MQLSIIIPVYNTENYLEKCFSSLLIEKCKYIEKHHINVLFVNDGSTDESQKIIDQFVVQYDFVNSIYQDNQGLSVARNTAIKNITSEYYMFLDSDDWLDMKKLDTVMDKLLGKNLDFISFGLSYYNENETFTGFRENQKVSYSKIKNGLAFLEEGYQPSSACLFLYNRKFILENDLWYFPGITQQDVEHSLRLMLKTKRGLFVEDKVYCYFRRSGSTTLPKTQEKLKKYLSDSITVAYQMSLNKKVNKSEDHNTLIEKNYNSVLWNLVWRFLSKPKEIDYAFKLKCLQDLKDKKLYPIKGSLKTKFQRLTAILFNNEFILKWVLKI